jgi:hypothetical protein
VNILIPLHGPLEGLVEEDTDGALPNREQINEVRDDGPFQGTLAEYLCHIAKISILTNNGRSTRVIDHVLNLIGRIDGRYGDCHGSNLLNSKKSDDPLDAIGDVNHDPITLPHPKVTQGVGKSVAEIPQLAIREPLAQIDNGRPIGISLTHAFKSREGVFLFFTSHFVPSFNVLNCCGRGGS